MKKIAIFQNRPGIGDMCVFLPMIHSIYYYYKKPVYLFTKSRSKAKELLKHDPSISKIFYTDKEPKLSNLFSFYFFIKKLNLNKIFLFSYSLKFYGIFKIAGVKKVFSYGLIKKNSGIINDAYNLLNRTIGKSNYNIKCKLFLGNRNLKKENICVIGIGGSGPTKKWPIANYKELILKMKKRGYHKFIIAGGKDEKKDSRLLENLFAKQNIISLCNETIENSIKVISTAKMYIGNDTGFMHISGLCGLKTYGLFGDTPVDYVSYNPKIVPIIPDGYKEIGHKSRAIKKISVSKVLKIIGSN